MSFNIYSTNDFKVSEWSGGSTVQFWIHPKNSTLDSRDFLFRISSANVQVEESVFSDFSGYSRKLMVLEGELLLQHQGQHSVLLMPFDQDTFVGSLKTVSRGMARDFNVIFKEQIKVDLGHHDVDAGGYHTIHDCEEAFIFVFKGEGEIKGIPFQEGQLIRIEGEQLISLHAQTALKLVVVQLKNVDK